ncbi:hypothetical protein SRB5_28770 [Streptomyces sp. RB5]|uniref:Uncharacterized protein n=1 Tax=Streptomyces smaragdinus TaxID=2585196 RepID=A0A7K0CH15_9ACTN|nr:hypothetical protein [Streptomyces smaragdinus]MQY12738.1 hypothetical protein [Streptomyces smaragdinus]
MKPRKPAAPAPGKKRPPHRRPVPHHQPQPYEQAAPQRPPQTAPSHSLTYVLDVEEPRRAEAARTAVAHRVLPFGTGLTLMGLGLGYIGLRLRRRV